MKPPKPVKKRTGRPGAFVRIVLLAMLAATVAAGAAVWRLLVTPWRLGSDRSVLVLIPARSSTQSILSALEEGGLLRDRRLGSIALKTALRGKTLKAGEYRFTRALSPLDLLLPIVAGEVVRWKVTIPEGFAADEIFALLEFRGFGELEEYRRIFASPREFASVPDGAPTLEGFLFPDTYSLTRPRTARDVAEQLTREFRLRLPAGYSDDARKAGLGLVGAVTLASMIEKETSVPDERPLVSAVYHNRLRIGMPLQCDPTTIYAMRRRGAWHGPLSRADLAVDDPYNTYAHGGLPPGPICSPGLPALRAAVAPAESRALYFVAKGDGSHTFSESYEGQQRNVARYRQSQRAARKDRAMEPAR
jgi:UPF0755 protein